MLTKYIAAFVLTLSVCSASNQLERSILHGRAGLDLSYPCTYMLNILSNDELCAKVGHLHLAAVLGERTQALFFEQDLCEVKEAFNFVNLVRRYRKPIIFLIDEIQGDYVAVEEWLKEFCSERSDDISISYLSENPIELTEEDAYSVRKYLLDKSLSIARKYPEEVELQRTIQALQLINEERDRTRLAELIKGGWKTDDRILKILSGEQ